MCREYTERILQTGRECYKLILPFNLWHAFHCIQEIISNIWAPLVLCGFWAALGGGVVTACPLKAAPGTRKGTVSTLVHDIWMVAFGKLKI